MNLAQYLGWLNVFILTVLVLVYIVRPMNQKYFHNNPKISKFAKLLSKVHPYFGFAFIASGAIHGYIALYGQFMLHTGTVLYFLIVLTVLSVVIGKALKFKKWFFLHKLFALLVIIALLIHIFFPDLLTF